MLKKFYFLLIIKIIKGFYIDYDDDEIPESGTIPLKFTIEKIDSDELLTTKIKIGDPPQEITLILDIGADRTWILKDNYKYSLSKTYSTDNDFDKRIQDNFSYSGVKSKETFTIGNKTLENFLFLLVEKIENKNFNGVLSLGREYDTKYFSLAYRLSSKMKTFYNSFVLKFEGNNTGELHIGDATDEIKIFKDLVLPCKLLDSEPKIKWKCQLTHVFIGGIDNATFFFDDYYEQSRYLIYNRSYKIENIDSPVYFETIYNKIYVTRKFIDYMKANLFIDKDGKSFCSLEDNYYKAYFNCSKSEVSKVPILNFVLSAVTDLSFPYNNLFECDDNNCISIIQYDSNFQGFVFGLPILKNYQMIFDYKSRLLQFYGKENKFLVKMPYTEGIELVNLLIYFIFFIIFFLLTSICVIYIIRSKNKKRKKIEEEIFQIV